MTIPSPNLDDRNFESLLAEARALIGARNGSWTDFNASDPGVILVELFAFLTETLLYRVNRVPEKAYIEFLRLLNVGVGAPAAARVTVQVRRDDETDVECALPAGVHLKADDRSGGEPILFITDVPITVPPGPEGTTVIAHHCTQVAGELLGRSSGEPGQRFVLAQAPVVLATGHELDLVIGVEASDSELVDRPNAREHQGVPYILWPTVDYFTEIAPGERAVVVDRFSGSVTFGPAVRASLSSGGVAADPKPIGAVPPAGRQIRAWYRRGGGAEGNVAQGTITSVVEATSVPLTLHNPERATGGRDAETVAQAVTRAASLFHEPRRAVTADDFEALAVRHGGVSRANAITAAEHWTHALPGEVQVRLVPSLPPEIVAPSAEEIADMTATTTIEAVQALIEQRQPLGVTTRVGWANYKRVSVRLRVVVARSEDADAVRRRVEDRMRDALNPVPTGTRPGWPFGQALRASNVYDIALREPGVRYADSVVMVVDETPDESVVTLVADPNQPRTWFASEGAVLFRSQNDGLGWEAVWEAAGSTITRVVPAPNRPGRLAIIVGGVDGKSSRLYLSADCGSQVGDAPVVSFGWDNDQTQRINDVCWLPAASNDDLLLATDRGLYRYRIGESAPRPWVVDPNNPARGCWSVTLAEVTSTTSAVLVALKERSGVWRSDNDAFRAQGLADADIRRLIVERRGNRRFLWAPAFAAGDDAGTGCYRAELVAGDSAALRWESFGEGWRGGICWDLAFLDDTILAASEFNGVLTRPYGAPETPWRSASLDSGLPLQDDARLFHRVSSLAAMGPTAMAGTRTGIYRSTDGRDFVVGAWRESSEIVTIPPGWLFASGDHVVEVVVEDR